MHRHYCVWGKVSGLDQTSWAAEMEALEVATAAAEKAGIDVDFFIDNHCFLYDGFRYFPDFRL